MESQADSITLNYADNEELKTALGGKEPGDEVTLTLRVTVRANSDDAFDAMIDDVQLDTSEEEPETEEVDEEDADVSVIAATEDEDEE
jgi:hypothetical protein